MFVVSRMLRGGGDVVIVLLQEAVTACVPGVSLPVSLVLLSLSRESTLEGFNLSVKEAQTTQQGAGTHVLLHGTAFWLAFQLRAEVLPVSSAKDPRCSVHFGAGFPVPTQRGGEWKTLERGAMQCSAVEVAFSPPTLHTALEAGARRGGRSSSVTRMESVVKKRRKYSTSSNDSDTTDSHVTSWSKSSKTTGTNSTWVRQEQKKPSEVFRTDFITAMKLPDSAQLSAEEFYVLSDPWRQEWEKGVQVPANIDAIPAPLVRMLPETNRIPFYSTPHARLHTDADSRNLGEPPTRYDLDDLDVAWLELVNTEFRELALPELDELSMERGLEELERQCQEKMQLAIETEEGLGIEYDEDVVCDVCRSPEGEDGNEMVFCDKCNICVHQACYGILKVPQGNWLCRTCALGVQPKCLLCPKRGGALKPTRSGTKWVHVSCALWIPEVSIGCPEKMEPITKVSHIPASRWALSCSLCREHTGTCIQCSMPFCVVAFHVTCAFDHGLEMHTILAENDEVRFKSYCLEHSYNTAGGGAGAAAAGGGGGSERPERRPDVPTPDRQKASQRKQKLQELEDEFYRLVEPREVADKLGLPDAHVDFLYQFWKLRRKSNFNQPLVAAKRDEVDNLAQQEQDVLYRRLKLFTHLRQDLERETLSASAVKKPIVDVRRHPTPSPPGLHPISTRP
ncbi:hypothetical protein ACEWY4_009870 [Coilia grayii]|uniref:Uncharacterized protein n=1 Tax=Coilia grayii TaxID=363190 RepID=A0ABD1K7S2_9TELE